MRTLLALLPLSTAHAVDLTGPDGYLYDIDDTSGIVESGSSGATDHWGDLCVTATPRPGWSCDPSDVVVTTTTTPDASGRVHTSDVFAHGSGLEVQREFFVPDTGALDYLRYRDILRNPTGRDVRVTLRHGASFADGFYGTLGSDALTRVFHTSDGSGVLSPAVHWFTTDDRDGSGAPALAFVVANGAPGAIGASTVALDYYGIGVVDNLVYEWEVDVPAGATVSVMHFFSQNDDQASATATATLLASPTPDVLFGLGPSDLASIVNFGGGGSGPNLTIAGGCPGTPTIDITGLTPSAQFVAIRSDQLGSATVPGGPCAGTRVDLANPRVIGSFPTSGGTRSFSPTIGLGGCGDVIQILDLDTCRTSHVEAL